MRAVFADTCYQIALLNPKDQTHDIAIRVSKGLTAQVRSWYGAVAAQVRGKWRLWVDSGHPGRIGA